MIGLKWNMTHFEVGSNKGYIFLKGIVYYHLLWTDIFLD